MKGKNIDVQVH